MRLDGEPNAVRWWSDLALMVARSGDGASVMNGWAVQTRRAMSIVSAGATPFPTGETQAGLVDELCDAIAAIWKAHGVVVANGGGGWSRHVEPAIFQAKALLNRIRPVYVRAEDEIG